MSITSHFFHNTLRKYIVAFGTLFNGITVQRANDLTINVPISYGSKQKWMARLQNDPELSKTTGANLPRLSFVITNIMYDTERKVSSIAKYAKVDPSDSAYAMKMYSPVPYRIDISLTIYSKNMADFLQIMEQIIPFFKPSFNITIQDVNDFSAILDVPIILNDVSIIHDSEGTFEDFRVINTDMNFSVLGYFFGPVYKQPLIKKVIVDTRLGYTKFADPTAEVDERYTVVPDPETAYATDDYGFTEWYESFPTTPPVPE